MNGDNRLNPAGVYPRKLIYSLRDLRSVMDARRIDSCLVCRNTRVNEAGLCPVCYAMLDGEELAQAVRWMNGQGP